MAELPPLERFRGDWLQTFTGRAFWPCDPDPEDVAIEDIAHALARQCRFGGHVTCAHYSVAEHSVRVSWIVPEAHALAALLHDAAEAYVIDVPRPVKNALGEAYRAIERGVARAVGLCFGVELVDLHPEVRLADEIMLATEVRDVMASPSRLWRPMPQPLPVTINPWSAEQAEQNFKVRLLELSGLTHVLVRESRG